MKSRRDRPIIVPGKDDPRPPIHRGYVVLALLFLGFLFVHNGVPLYTDWLWFGEVGYRTVFTTTIIAKTLLFFGFGALFFAIFYTNVRIARHLAPEHADRFLMERFGPEWARSLQRGIGWILLGVAIFLSLWAGRLAADNWLSWLQFTHWTPFHVADPVFGNDVGFYIFRLPFLRFVWIFCLSTLLVTAIAVVAIHVADSAIESWAGLPQIASGVRVQLLALLTALAITTAFGTRLIAYDLLTGANGRFTGAGYVDVHYRLFALDAQIVCLVFTALACLATMRRGPAFRWPVYGVGAWLAALVLLGQVVPAIVQKASVEPNEFTMEQSYIARNIKFTRLGFNLQDVRQVDTFHADNNLTAAALQSNRDTLENVRLWDYQYLAKVYSQLQTVKTYYKFEKVAEDGSVVPNIDIDRYKVAGRLRQVMLGAREMDPTGLPESAQTWQNQKLAYTHGYGVAMSPVNKVLDGKPDYFLSGIPLTGSPEASNLKVSQPDIYFGQLADSHVFVETAQPEFDYPSTDLGGANGAQDHYTTYTGHGGIRIGDAPLAKLAFSLRLGDANVLLARGFKPETRVLFRRDIRERVETIAPFLQQDGDPYLVVDPDTGRLVWIIDCYTLSDRFPYSTAEDLDVNPVTFISPNYIRNSVKATVDAYDGTVNLYIADSHDPIAKTYGEIYPGLLKPLSALPAGLRAHLRYPEDLFRVQRSVYAAYHVDDPRVFYLKEDAWAVPVEPNGDQSTSGGGQQMEPYYVIMRLPAGTDGPGVTDLNEEFLLMSPLAPINREAQNILGWMCARCDGDRYGQLVLYRFPQTASVEGPSQIVQRINSDATISPKLTLLRSGGSAATLGNLLVIPIDDSLLYIAPLYVEAATSATKLPQLQKVVVASGEHVAMEDTLEAALADLFSGYNAPSGPETGTSPTGTTPPSGPPSNVPAPVRRLIDQAAAQYATAQQKLKAGDFAGYGAALKDLERTLNDLRHAAGSAR